jgi:hypothetical protein
MSTTPTLIDLQSITPLPDDDEAIVYWLADNSLPARKTLGYLNWASRTLAGAMRTTGDLYNTGQLPLVGGLKGIRIIGTPTADLQVLVFKARSVSDTGVAFGDFVFQALAAGSLNVHDEPLTDGNSNFIFAGGDIIVVVGVPNS